MSDHAHDSVTRHCDVAVIGGSAAGLAAALQLGRQRRSVIVVDAEEPRHATAAHMHGYLGHDGAAPSELSRIGREEVRSYGVEVLAGRACSVARADDGRFRVDLVGGHVLLARRVLAATGVVDELPDIDGLAQHWGSSVIHCPFCHGYEARDQRIVQIVTHAAGLHPAPLFRQLTDRLTLVVADAVEADERELDALRADGVEIVRTSARRVIARDESRVVAVELEDGHRLEADVVAVTPRFRARVEPFEPLGLRTVEHPLGLGDCVEADASGATSIPGLYAAGNVTDPSQQLLHAAADGSRVGATISFSLAEEDVQGAARPSANESDWDTRYSGSQFWSGNPNGTLVEEVGDMAPGRALDVGAGEGGDAIWLAERGWRVVASDISESGLGRLAAEARRRGLDVTCRRVDANALDAFGDETYDLVSAFYAAVPRTADERGVRNLLRAVAPRGTLLVVGHDPEPMRAAIDTRAQSRAFDPDAFVRVDDVAAVLDETPGWDVTVHETRPRPEGSATDAHHHHDVVVRARRVPG